MGKLGGGFGCFSLCVRCAFPFVLDVGLVFFSLVFFSGLGRVTEASGTVRSVEVLLSIFLGVFYVKLTGSKVF